DLRDARIARDGIPLGGMVGVGGARAPRGTRTHRPSRGPLSHAYARSQAHGRRLDRARDLPRDLRADPGEWLARSNGVRLRALPTCAREGYTGGGGRGNPKGLPEAPCGSLSFCYRWRPFG